MLIAFAQVENDRGIEVNDHVFANDKRVHKPCSKCGRIGGGGGVPY